MTGETNVTSITVDLRPNVLLLHLDGMEDMPSAIDAADLPGTLDVGAYGWLLGVEIGDRYFPVADALPGTDHLIRTRDAKVSLLASDAVIVVPRRGSEYELSFPSGNQCWLRSTSGSGDGPTRLCSTIAAAP